MQLSHALPRRFFVVAEICRCSTATHGIVGLFGALLSCYWDDKHCSAKVLIL